jgi:hypothetical protein
VPGRENWFLRDLTIPGWRPFSRSPHSRNLSKRTDAGIIRASAIEQNIAVATGRRRVGMVVTLTIRQGETESQEGLSTLFDSLKVAGMILDGAPAFLAWSGVEYRRGEKTLTVITLEDLD